MPIAHVFRLGSYQGHVRSSTEVLYTNICDGVGYTLFFYLRFTCIPCGVAAQVLQLMVVMELVILFLLPFVLPVYPVESLHKCCS